jgi:hypothetical protein
MRAGAWHSIGRRFHHAFQPAANKFLLPGKGFNLDELSRKNQRDKHSVAVVMRQAVAAIHKFLDSYFHSGRFP